MSDKPDTLDRGILRGDEGLVQLQRCPVCNYLVRETDIMYKRQPVDMRDPGIVDRCRFCGSPEQVTVTLSRDEHERLLRIEDKAKTFVDSATEVYQMKPEQWKAYLELKALFHGGILFRGYRNG